MASISQLLWTPKLKYSTKYFHGRPPFNKFRVRSIRTIDASPTADLKITKNEPEFIFPAQPTPTETKPLSDLDNWYRGNAPLLFIYKRDARMEGKDAADVIKQALTKALVYYYPLAGRLFSTIDVDGRSKLWVDCGGVSGGGALFVRAEADIELEAVGDNILPPNPCAKQLVCTQGEEKEGKEFESSAISGPLLHIQVTKFKCGGVVLGLVMHHSVADGYGIALFVATMGELARGQNAPTISPVWLRDQFMCARPNPQVRYVENQFRNIKDSTNNLKSMIQEIRETTPISIFLNSKDIQALRDRHNLQSCTKFELVTAYLWKCRTLLRGSDPNDITRLSCVTSIRGTRIMKGLPRAYYGNSVFMPSSTCAVRDLVDNPLSDVVELVKKTKLKVRDPEYVRSFIDHIATKSSLVDLRLRFAVSDLSRLGAQRFDFGWGNPMNFVSAIVRSTMIFYQTYSKSDGGEDEMMITMRAPPGFEDELKRIE
ncbi:hypothetical protein M569_15095 [Genlisea aurea]|uniref:Uncharacterized protein n=1 Tax=Genlisea aurea TaxID=192259 RepID=S8BYP6_9LAMI|nr:hypothetical protein M569_15095 [Genlisea aurea]